MVAIRCSPTVLSGLAVLFVACPIRAGGITQDDARHLRSVWPLVHVPDPVANRATREALDGAWARLAKPACQTLLTDFTDQNGRVLADRLSAFDVDIQTYLTMVVFIDDTGGPPVRRRAQANLAAGPCVHHGRVHPRGAAHSRSRRESAVFQGNHRTRAGEVLGNVS
jgi:hypothetical protein